MDALFASLFSGSCDLIFSDMVSLLHLNSEYSCITNFLRTNFMTQKTIKNVRPCILINWVLQSEFEVGAYGPTRILIHPYNLWKL